MRGEWPWEPGTECTQEFHFLIAFALETWLLSHLGMGECFTVDKKYFSGLRGFAIRLHTKDQARNEIYK